MKAGLRPDISRINQPALSELMQRMWLSDAAQRPSATQVVSALEAVESGGSDVSAKVLLNRYVCIYIYIYISMYICV